MGKNSQKEKIEREFSAGGVVCKKTDKAVVWLVTKSSPSKLYPKSVWRLPKGWLDDSQQGKKPGFLAKGIKKAKEEEIRKAALREVSEEGGVNAKIVEKIETVKFFIKRRDKKILKFITFYLMEWISDLEKGHGYETEETKWLTYPKARETLTFERERKILDKAKNILEKRGF